MTTCACGARCFDRGNGHADICEDCSHRWMDEQASRIAELEGALRTMLAYADLQLGLDNGRTSNARRNRAHARRVLGEGGAA